MTFNEVLICPNCKSDNCYELGTDEIEFDTDGTGHYYADCYCSDCKKYFRLYTNFEYSITKAHTRPEPKHYY